MNYLIYIILLVSVICNIAFLYFDVIPFLKNVLKQKEPKGKVETKIDLKTFENEILKTSFDIIEKEEQLTTWDKKQYISERLFHFIKGTKSSSFKKFHFPVAFLYQGISAYLISNNNSEISRFKTIFDKILDNQGQPKFTMDKPDQVPFGMTSLSFYEKFREEKYLNFSQYIYQFILKNLNENQIVLYNKNSDNQYVDVLGMVVPFLAKYYQVTGNTEALDLTKKQIDFFEEYGLDQLTFLPSHAFQLNTKIKTGSVNWGRGFGWYLLGINAVNSVDQSYQSKIELSYQNIPSVKSYIYSQFPGSSQKVDISVTAMLLNCFFDAKIINIQKEEFLNIFQKYVEKGYVMQTSGDTIGINDYSDFFGKSEFSQGMFLLILSKLN